MLGIECSELPSVGLLGVRDFFEVDVGLSGGIPVFSAPLTRAGLQLTFETLNLQDTYTG